MSRFSSRSMALAIFLIVAVSSLVTAQAPLPLTLEEAIARALEKNESILIEMADREAAFAAEEGAEGAYDPRLGFSLAYQRTSQPVNSSFSGAPEGEPAPTDERFDGSANLLQLLPTGGEVSVRASNSRTETNGAFGLLSPAYGSQLGVELRQPLLRDRKIDAARLGLRVTAADRERAVAAVRREVRDTVAATEQAYWNLVAARREIEVRQETIALAEEQLGQTELRIETGLAPEKEVAQPRAELARRRGDLLASQEAVSRAETALKLLLLGDDEGQLWARPLEPVDAVEMDREPVDAGAAMEQALATRAEIAEMESFVERRRLERAFAVDRIRPTLDLVVSYDRFGLTGSRNSAANSIPGLEGEIPPELVGGFGSSIEALAEGEFDDARIALEMGITLGNRTSRANVVIARAAQRQAMAEVSRARKFIRAEVLDAVATLGTAAGRIDAAAAAREAAQVQLSSERDRYDAGLSTTFLVLTRQNDLASARLAEIEALTDYRTARAELARATGSLLTERGIEVSDR